MAGLRPAEVDEVVKIIRFLREQGITILVIEHVMRAIMALSDCVVVIHFGTDETVFRSYFQTVYIFIDKACFMFYRKFS